MPFMYIYYSYTDRSIAQLVLQKYHFADSRRLLCSFIEMGREFVCLQITDNHCPLGMHPPSPPTNNELIKYLYAWRSGTLIRVCSNLCVVFSARRFSQKISFNINPLWSNLIKDSPLYSHPIFPKTQLETNDTGTELRDWRTTSIHETSCFLDPLAHGNWPKFDQIFCRCHYTTVANSFLPAGRQCHNENQRGCTALRYSKFQLTRL